MVIYGKLPVIYIDIYINVVIGYVIGQQVTSSNLPKARITNLQSTFSDENYKGIILVQYCTCTRSFNSGNFVFYEQSHGERSHIRPHTHSAIHPISSFDTPTTSACAEENVQAVNIL